MRVLVLLSCCVFFAACLSGDTVVGPGPPPTTGCITIGPRVTPATATLHVGDTLRVAAAAQACGGSPVAVQFIWTASDTTVASVDSLSGLVRARRDGVVTVVASEQTERVVQGAMLLQVVP